MGKPVTAIAGNLTAEAKGQLKSICERVERLTEEKAAIQSDIKMIYGEAKGNGFDTGVLKKVVRLRAMEKNKRQTELFMLDLYLGALGLKSK